VAGVIPARRTYGSLSARRGPLAEVGEGVGWRSYPHAPKKLGLDAAFGRGPQMLWTCRYREGPNTSRLGPAPKRYLATPCAGVTGRRSRFLGPEVRNAHNPFCALSDFSASENWLGWVTYVLVAADTNSAGWSDGQAVFGESGPARRGRPDKTAVASCAASPLFSAGQELPFGPPKPTANQRTSAEDFKGEPLDPFALSGEFASRRAPLRSRTSREGASVALGRVGCSVLRRSACRPA
jgi:hypothetical protein